MRQRDSVQMIIVRIFAPVINSLCLRERCDQYDRVRTIGRRDLVTPSSQTDDIWTSYFQRTVHKFFSRFYKNGFSSKKLVSTFHIAMHWWLFVWTCEKFKLLTLKFKKKNSNSVGHKILGRCVVTLRKQLDKYKISTWRRRENPKMMKKTAIRSCVCIIEIQHYFRTFSTGVK